LGSSAFLCPADAGIMLPRDGMHEIDFGAIIRLIMAKSLKYFECVEKILNMEGLAASIRAEGKDAHLLGSASRPCRSTAR
jgi:hypothetical protein